MGSARSTLSPLGADLCSLARSAPAVSSKLKLFDREALGRWKKLQGEQQAKLQEVSPPSHLSASRTHRFGSPFEQLGVPTFFRTRSEPALKKQERVMAVLLGFLEDEPEQD